MAREKYGRALRQTGQLIQPPNSPSLDVTMRSVVMLAMYEVGVLALPPGALLPADHRRPRLSREPITPMELFMLMSWEAPL